MLCQRESWSAEPTHQCSQLILEPHQLQQSTIQQSQHPKHDVDNNYASALEEGHNFDEAMAAAEDEAEDEEEAGGE